MRNPTVFAVCVMIWILIGIFCLLHKRWIKRLHSKPPDRVVDLLSQLPKGWELLTYRWDGEMEWTAEIGFEGRRFVLSTDFGPICDWEIVDGEARQIPERQSILSDTLLLPKSLLERLLEATKRPRLLK